MADTSASPPQRLCDVCADDREATHFCLQCQQRFCLPCRKNHDSFRLFGGHTVVSLTQEEGCGKGIPLPEEQEMEMCPRHSDQRLLLHCNQCRADLCLQCKLTQHEGHPTEDLTHARSRVKEKLKDRLGSLVQQLQRIDHMVGACEDRSAKLQQQKQMMEQGFRARADTLHQWVNQSLDDALGSAQSSCEQLARPWQDQAEELRHKKLAVQAQQDHILRVLKEGKEADIVSLEAQLSSSPMEEVNVTRMERELTRDIPTLLVEHNTTAVNQPQLRAFIGVLEPVRQTSSAEETVATRCAQGKASGAVSVKESDLTHGSDSPSSASDPTAVTKQSREFVYSTSPKAVVVALCPISHDRLWVMFRPAEHDPLCLKLFGAEGQVLTTVEIPVGTLQNCDGLFAVTDDVMVAWRSGSELHCVIMPDGSLNRFRRSSLEWYVPRATSHVNYRKCVNSQNVNTVKFAISKTFPGYWQDSCVDSVSTDVSSDREPAHVSAGGRYFAFLAGKTVEVYARARRRLIFFSSYKTKVFPTDARFCLMEGRELLLVTVCDDDRVHVIDHTDGGRFVRCLDTGPLNLDRPWCLATDFNRHMWVGCEGGRVVKVDL